MSDIIYGIDAKKNLMTVSENKSFAVGDTTTINGIEVYCIRAGDANVSLNEMTAIDDTPPIFVDKNHDLSYYIKGSDYVNSMDYNQSPGTFGYEWGGEDTKIGGTVIRVGAGLANTNALIRMNIQPNTESWWVVWDKVEEFRQSHSNKWFVPSRDELNLVYQQKASLNNLTTSGYAYYWSSSEASSANATVYSFWSGNLDYNNKENHTTRTRLCYMP